MGKNELVPEFLSSFSAIGYVSCEQRCQGSPRMYNGKRCASTTRYNDYHKGACGCGPASGDSQFGWNHDHFVTAPNQMFFDEGGSGWCGQRCGKCVKLTTTGIYDVTIIYVIGENFYILSK